MAINSSSSGTTGQTGSDDVVMNGGAIGYAAPAATLGSPESSSTSTPTPAPPPPSFTQADGPPPVTSSPDPASAPSGGPYLGGVDDVTLYFPPHPVAPLPPGWMYMDLPLGAYIDWSLPPADMGPPPGIGGSVLFGSSDPTPVSGLNDRFVIGPTLSSGGTLDYGDSPRINDQPGGGIAWNPDPGGGALVGSGTTLEYGATLAGAFTATFSWAAGGSYNASFDGHTMSGTAVAPGQYSLAGNFMAHRDGANLAFIAQAAATNFVSAAGVGGQTVTGDSVVSGGTTLTQPGVDKPH